MELRVFLVEDLQSIRGLMEELFTSIGGMRLVGTVGTEAEAKLWLDDHPGGWDLAIIDLVLDQGTGMNVIRSATQPPHTGRVAVFSSYVSSGVIEHCLRLGADAVFDKSDTEAFVRWLDAQRR